MPESGASCRVLVVEDEPLINQAVTDRLRGSGYDVVQAWDGPGAVAQCAESTPDLVVLDVMLPGFDGHEVCRRIQGARPVPVLMLTARDDEADILVGLGVGAKRASESDVPCLQGRSHKQLVNVLLLSSTHSRRSRESASLSTSSSDQGGWTVGSTPHPGGARLRRPRGRVCDVGT